VGGKDFERREDRDREDETRDSKAPPTEECGAQQWWNFDPRERAHNRTEQIAVPCFLGSRARAPRLRA